MLHGNRLCSSIHCTKKASAMHRWYKIFPDNDSEETLAILSVYTMRVRLPINLLSHANSQLKSQHHSGLCMSRIAAVQNECILPKKSSCNADWDACPRSIHQHLFKAREVASLQPSSSTCNLQLCCGACARLHFDTSLCRRTS